MVCEPQGENQVAVGVGVFGGGESRERGGIYLIFKMVM